MPTFLEPISVIEGVEPSTDKPKATTRHYTFTKGIRFVDGLPEKIGGWRSIIFNNNNTIIGSARSIFSYSLSGFSYYNIGTNVRLYGLLGTSLTNITPVKTTTVTAADSLDTFYGTLSADPFTTVSGSTTVTITDTAHKLQPNDVVTFSGSSAVNGIPAGELNTSLAVRSTTANTYTVIVNTAATSSGAGGGGSVVRATGVITLNKNAHSLSNGDRVKIQSAATTGGVTDAQINLEFIIRNAQTNSFDFYTAGTATSAVTGGGGGSTTYQEPIDPGSADTIIGQGYGLGLYGVGLYGVSKPSFSTIPPRIWSHDKFGDLVVMCPGAQGDIYSWDNVFAEAPVKVSNSPPANYVFVSNNIVVALGYDTASTTEQGGGISWSDQGGLTNWTTGQAGSDIIEGANIFISHVSTRGENLLFTENQTYIFRYIGGQFIWQTSLLENGIGIISQNARVTVSGVAYWMGNGNFYQYRGANVEVIPSNTSTECTALRYVFDNLNYSQKEKIFCQYNDRFREISWHYPSAASNEPDRIIRLNIDTLSWCIDEIDRTAAEYPVSLNQNPYLIDSSNTLYLHETGSNDDESPLEFRFTTPYMYGGTDTVQISAFIPEHTFSNSINVNLKTRNWPQSSDIVNIDYTLTPVTDRVSTEVNGRFWQFDVTGNVLGQEYAAGQWYKEIKRSTPK